MKGTQMVVCGLGGQGILFLTRLVGQAARISGQETITSETHGMSQRGGAVDSHVKIGPYRGSLVRRGRADVAFALDPSRATAARGFLREGGVCFVDAPTGTTDGTHFVDAASAARRVGNPRGSNLVLLGYASAVAPDLFPPRQALLDAVETLSPAPFTAKNREAFLEGEKLA